MSVRGNHCEMRRVAALVGGLNEHAHDDKWLNTYKFGDMESL